MMNTINICVALSDNKSESQKSLDDSIRELSSIVKRHAEWIGSSVVLINNEKNGKVEEKVIFQALYDYNEETEDEEFTTWYDDQLMEKLNLNKISVD